MSARATEPPQGTGLAHVERRPAAALFKTGDNRELRMVPIRLPPDAARRTARSASALPEDVDPLIVYGDAGLHKPLTVDDTTRWQLYIRHVRFMRHLARSAFVGVMLAYALALSGLAGARLAGGFAAHASDVAALKLICAEHGLTLPSGDGGDGPHQHRDCPACLASACKSVGHWAQPVQVLTTIWRRESSVVYAGLRFDLPKPRAPPSVSARGPPVLI